MELNKKRKVEENGEGGGLRAEEWRRVLEEAVTQEQALDILQEALLRHSDVVESVRALANRDTAHRKLFVRGLSADTTSESLRSVFGSFGELDEAIVIFDKSTAKSKGYGFVTFKNADSAFLALRHPSKKIDGRITVSQFAAAGNTTASSDSNSDVSSRKIYVGNVPFDISSDRLLSHFMMYGDIEEGPLGFDRSTGKSRGFAFFVFRSDEGARAALVDPVKSIDGHQVSCKLAVDNKKPRLGPNPNPTPGPPPQDSSAAPSVVPFQGTQYAPPPQGLYYPSHGQGPPPALPVGNYSLNASMPVQGNFAAPYGPPAGDFSARLPPSTGGGGGGYADGSQFNLGSSGIPGGPQHSQQPPMPRIPPGGMYQGLHHYY